MKRREFLNISLPATGAIMVTPGLINERIFQEINRQFLGKGDFNEYDLIINGAGLAGYFAAVEASKKGKKVLVVDKRTSPGYDIWAKKKLWLGSSGVDQFDDDLNQLFFPEGELQEILHSSDNGPNGSLFDDELALFAGSIRKGILRNLLLNKVHVLLMTDVCGVLTGGGAFRGILTASKHGIHTISGKQFVDASDHLTFSRMLSGEETLVKEVGFVVELLGVEDPSKKDIPVSESLGLKNNSVTLHVGKRELDHAFLEFTYIPESNDFNDLEQQSRRIAAEIGKSLGQLDTSFGKAQIQQFAIENSYTLKNEELPVVKLDGYTMVQGLAGSFDCESVLKLRREVAGIISTVKYVEDPALSLANMIKLPGTEIPISEVEMKEVVEPGLAVPMNTCSFDFGKYISRVTNTQVLIAGGGTSGALAALGAAEKGVNTVVVDYFNDLGGTKTMGSVMGYYHGVKDNKFFKAHVDDAESLASERNMSKRSGRIFHHLKSLTELNSRVLGGAIIAGSLVEGSNVKGIVICRNGRLEKVIADRTIDSTGDGDVAYFAGAEFDFGDSRFGQTQNYSQWDIKGVKNLPSDGGRDYDIIDNTYISELQRAFFLSHYEAHYYDFNPMLTVRESRRIKGLHELNLIDAVEKTHFNDMISEASSDYDPHNVGVTPYTRCGFLLPHSNIVKVEIPYRCIVPKDLDGILISGRGFSQTHNALQFTRMTADLIVLGYLTGQIAADQVWKKTGTHNYDILDLQKEWVALGYLPQDFHSRKEGSLNGDRDEMNRRISSLSSGKEEYLYECVLLPKEKAIPGLLKAFEDGADSTRGQLLLAKALAWFGRKEGSDLIEEELRKMFDQELNEGYPGGYVDEYDSIRGREKNILKGLFWRINQNIALLGMAGYEKSKETVKYILENTISGGGMVERSNAYYNGRIDLKIIPFHNRILNLCFFAERVPDKMLISGFEKLFEDKFIGGFVTNAYNKVRWRVYGAGLELAIASAIARCGGQMGYQLLVEFIGDIHVIFKKFASEELVALTGQDFGYDRQKWSQYISKKQFPLKSTKLTVDEIEV
ncbi:FAD-dependent oxidoreductase [Membranihabitans maritimus]|uniref:FAD-dependent oxidoreductase n=1 Tax=Membranihabitans maritimus TaxID=2904244 RepID=UPI001F3B8B47|nr:FAD-dependent oxidoreductase [Membranihabitans maritimus]